MDKSWVDSIADGLRTIKEQWVLPDENRNEAPRARKTKKIKPGELHYIAPGGKLEIIAELGSGTDERNIKRVLDILLKSDNDYYFGDNGITE